MSNEPLGTDSGLDQLRAAFDHKDARDRLCSSLGMSTGPGGRHWCPFCQQGANHTTPDFSTEAGFRCHKCGFHGDAFKLTQEIQRCDFKVAKKFLLEIIGIPSTTTIPVTRQKARGKLHADADAAASAALWSVNGKKGTTFKESARYPYHDHADTIIAYVIRFDRADGQRDEYGKIEKTFVPIHRDGDGWRVGDPPGLWPLYRLPDIRKSSGPVFICEGEKACDAGRSVGLTCTTSAHGSQSPQKTDWSPLAARVIYILPDNDAAGVQYARTVAAILSQPSPESPA